MALHADTGLPPAAVATQQARVTATVIFHYVWDINDLAQETVTYTTTYIGSPAFHTVFAMVVNDRQVRASQTQVVAVPVTITSPGGTYTCEVPATKAMHRATVTSSNLKAQESSLATMDAVVYGTVPTTSAIKPSPSDMGITTGQQTTGLKHTGPFLALIACACVLTFLYRRMQKPNAGRAAYLPLRK